MKYDVATGRKERGSSQRAHMERELKYITEYNKMKSYIYIIQLVA